MLERIPQPPQALHQADTLLQPLMQSVRAAVFASPLDLSAVRASLIALFEYLRSSTGRTDANCWAVDHFFTVDDHLPLERLPNSLQDVFAHMDALHDTITAPQVAENFG